MIYSVNNAWLIEKFSEKQYKCWVYRVKIREEFKYLRHIFSETNENKKYWNIIDECGTFYTKDHGNKFDSRLMQTDKAMI